MRGFADASGLTLNDVVFANFLYELDSYCTAVVVRDVNGNIFHERNLDFYFANDTRPIIYIGEFYKKG